MQFCYKNYYANSQKINILWRFYSNSTDIEIKIKFNELITEDCSDFYLKFWVIFNILCVSKIRKKRIVRGQELMKMFKEDILVKSPLTKDQC